jgi:hypothetical protein
LPVDANRYLYRANIRWSKIMADKFRIPIDGSWDLHDLYQFPHTYTQIYSVLFVLEEDLPTARQMRRAHIFSSYPWRGGYSAVNWYNSLYYMISNDERPQIIAMRYESPGWLDLGLYVGIAIA